MLRLALVALAFALPAEAAQTVTRGNPVHITLSTNVLQINGIGGADWICNQEGEVDLYVVTGSFTDGGALPADGWWLIPAGATACYYIGASGTIGLAGSSAGDVNVLFR